MTESKKIKPTNLLSIESEVNRIRQKWNTHYKSQYLAAEKSTNEILAECKTAVDKIRTDKEEIKCLTKALKARGFKPNSASTLYHKMLTLVMSDAYDDKKRKSVSRWAKTLLIADSHGIKGNGLVTWIEKKGGINEIAYPEKNKVKKAEIRDQNIAIAETYFSDIANVDTSFTKTKTSPEYAGFVVMLGEVKPDYSVGILNYCQSESLINQILEQEGRKKETQNKVNQRKITKKETNKALVIDKMVKKVVKSHISPKVPVKSNPIHKKKVNEGER